VADSRLSEAVVVYIWGRPRTLPYPSSHPDDVAKTFGDDAADLVPYVTAVLDEAYAQPVALWGKGLLQGRAD
jgi:hypothetical protein